MSVTHKIIFESKRKPLELQATLLKSNIGLRETINERMRGEALHSWISTAKTEYDQDYFNEYGIRVNRTAYFDMDTHEDWDQGIKIVGRSVAKLLKIESGDALFLNLGQIPILKRINNKMTVTNEIDFIWLTSALDEEGLDYEIQQIEAVYA